MVVEIDYGDLKSASSELKKAAKYCGEYADKLYRKVPNKIDNLTRGTSRYTSNASYFASVKIKSLESQQQKCLNISGKIDSFIENARSTDRRVANIMRSVGNEFRKSNDISYGWADGFMQVITGFTITEMNKSEFSRLIAKKLRDASERFNAGILSVRNLYRIGGGKYVINAVCKAVNFIAATVIAYTALMVAMPVVFPFLVTSSAVALISWSGLCIVCSAVSACIILSDTWVAFMNASVAVRIAKTEPGWAARYANMTTTTDYLQKIYLGSEWDKFSMRLAEFIDCATVVCGVITLGRLVTNGCIFFTNSYRTNANWKNQFKMWDSNGKFSLDKTTRNWKKNLKGLKYAFTHDFQYTQLEGARKRNYSTYDFVKSVEESKYYKNVKKLFEKLENIVGRHVF